jgi:hypothetical protein
MQPTNETPITLTLGLVNGILQYLGTRPYQEVFPLVAEIQNQATPQVPMPESAKGTAEGKAEDTVQ